MKQDQREVARSGLSPRDPAARSRSGCTSRCARRRCHRPLDPWTTVLQPPVLRGPQRGQAMARD